jgi:hypothetical protein
MSALGFLCLKSRQSGLSKEAAALESSNVAILKRNGFFLNMPNVANRPEVAVAMREYTSKFDQYAEYHFEPIQ